MIISRTPLRLSFFGGGTDYEDFFQRQPGAVLGTTIDKYIYITLNRVTACSRYQYRVSYGRVEESSTLDEIQHPAMRECLRALPVSTPVEIHTIADLPARTGLGSSSAFTVGLAHALKAQRQDPTSPDELARVAIKIERESLEEAVGWQDQHHAAFGGLNLIEFHRDSTSVATLQPGPERIRALESSLMLFFTGVTRNSGDFAREQIRAIREGTRNAALQEMRDQAYQARDWLMKLSPAEIAPRFGGLLRRAWDLKRSISPVISNPDIDRYYANAMKAGAYGGKLAGAGGGGFLWFLVPQDARAAVRDALRPLPEIPVRFDTTGSRVLFNSETDDCPGTNSTS